MNETNIYIGETEIDDIFIGSMGIQAVYLGDELIYSRKSSYFYLELED